MTSSLPADSWPAFNFASARASSKSANIFSRRLPSAKNDTMKLNRTDSALAMSFVVTR
jgi:hypothetical protein